MIIGISGILKDGAGNKQSAGSGKDTVADLLVEEGFTKIALADPIKKFCKEIFNFSDEQLFGPSEMRSKTNPNMITLDGNELSPRTALQICGTEFGRYCYPDVWVEYCIKTANQLLQNNDLLYDNALGINNKKGKSVTKGVVVSDCRFLNEINKIKSVGKIIRVKRRINEIKAVSNHESESEIVSIPDEFFDIIIDNSGTIEDLRKSVKKAISVLCS